MEGFYLLNTYALIILFVLSMIFFSKKRLKQTEDNIYAFLLIVCLITITCGVCSGFFVGKDSFILNIINMVVSKGYMVGLIWMISVFAYYTICISEKTKKLFKFLEKVGIYFLLLVGLLIFILPAEFVISEKGMIVSGIGVNVTYMLFGLIYFFLNTLVFLDIKHIKESLYQ